MIMMRSNEAENDYILHLTTLHILVHVNNRQLGVPLHYAPSQRGRVVHCTAFCTSDCPGLEFKNGTSEKIQMQYSFSMATATGRIFLVC